MAPAINKRALPSKEAGLFKEVLACYEAKQLKKGIKAADAILKKFPEHGETLSMKGLLFVHQGKRDEGQELVKKGIRNDLTSHIVWHVYGLIQKGEKKWEEALKSYTQALKCDRDNITIMRDAATIQAHLRQYDALVDSRLTLLKLRPNVRQSWVALAVAYHLNGDLVEAEKIVSHYEETLREVPDYDVEYSEVLLYHIRLLENLGRYADALSLLDTSAKSRAIVDRTAIMELRARLISSLGQPDEAEHAWRALIQQNSDYHEYFRGFLATKGVDLEHLTDETRPKALQLLRDFSEQIPRAAAPRRLALLVAQGDEFSELVKLYITSGLTRGIPSLFVDLKSLYSDEHKRDTIESIVDEIRASLASTGSVPGPADEPPTTYLWTLYFLAQHHSTLGRPARALDLVTAALAHTPTLPELHTARARILKRAGDPFGAARALEDARLLDGQDRFLNTKCAKYRLRAGLVDEASEILGMFTKKDALSPGADLEDMQSLLYLLEEGAAHERNGKLGMALKRYTAVHKVFQDFSDDQYDFHSYSLRKFNLNAYASMITWADNLRSHSGYVTAALGATRIYIRIHDDPSVLAAFAAGATLTDAEKKAKSKAKKAAQKVQESAKKAPPASTNEDKGLEPPAPKDDDPDGSKLVSAAGPLEHAARWLAPLVELDVRNVDVWLAVYDVSVRRQKYLQAAKALARAHALDGPHAALHTRFIDLRTAVSALPASLPAPAGPALATAVDALIPAGVDLGRYNAEYTQRHAGDPRAALAGARALRRLGAPRDEVEGAVFGVLAPDAGDDVKTAQEALAFLKEVGSPRADEFRKACAGRFAFATVFGTPEETAELRRTAVVGNVDGDGGDAQELVG